MTEQNITSANNVLDKVLESIPGIKMYNRAEYLSKQFFTDIEDYRKMAQLKSGFANLDKITPLYPGLYVLGAVPSIGKTTFVHQMCEQIAESGSHILYFALEQTNLELSSKSVACSIAKEDPANSISSQQVKTSSPSDPRIVASAGRCGAHSYTMNVLECQFRVTINNIVDIVQAYIEQNKAKPIVAIDYLQLIQTDQEILAAKDSVDHHMRRLKELQMDSQLIIIVISSLNRQSYTASISFESFKESGGIEYTADVLWGLQYQCIHEKIFSSNKNNDKNQRITEAKLELPRKIELVCLKNRFGVGSYTCLFDYYPNFDRFIPDMSNLDTWDITNSTDTDRWIPVTDEMENELPWDI